MSPMASASARCSALYRRIAVASRSVFEAVFDKDASGEGLYPFVTHSFGGRFGWLRWPVVVAGLAQGTGVALFFYTMWSRIRPVGSLAREAKGERF